MKISDTYGLYSTNNNTGTASKKPSNEKDYSNYLVQKYPCLTSGKNAAVSVTGGLLRKAVTDEKTGEWLERELAKAPDYIEAAQKSAIAHGSTLKFVSIEFGEEYSTMTVCTVTDGGGKDPEIDKWLERIKEKKEKQIEENRKLEKKQSEKRQEKKRSKEASFTTEFKGKDIEELMKQFDMKLSGKLDMFPGGSFDVSG
ncbi:MAG: hypothetical protein K6G83_14090 [Lachnospiraceae bacterium]|nr:hypothetical protein [Lachnospiraceae bacterium]